MRVNYTALDRKFELFGWTKKGRLAHLSIHLFLLHVWIWIYEEKNPCTPDQISRSPWHYRVIMDRFDLGIAPMSWFEKYLPKRRYFSECQSRGNSRSSYEE